MTQNTSTLAPVLPALDLEVGEAIGDEILLASAATDKVAKVTGSLRGQFQSHSARAWTMGGAVD